MKKKMMLWGIGALLISVVARAQQKYELSVKEAVELAYKNVIELKNAQIDYDSQAARNKEILCDTLE